MNLDTMRPGQKAGFDVIAERFLDGENYTSIILPTRYGKSDLIFCAPLQLFTEGKIATSIAMSPNELLRDQLVAPDKVSGRVARYGINMRRIKFGRIERLPKKSLAPNKEFFLSSTIQLVSRNVDIFGELIDEIQQRVGLPVLVQVDESHTGSEDNTWGQTLMSLVDRYGAKGVVYTATATRSDGKIPPGFRAKYEDSRDVVIHKTFKTEKPDIFRIEVYDGIEKEVEIEADHETTFQEAWGESPAPLLQIDWFPFDVQLSELSDGSPDDIRLLSQLSLSDTRKVLGRAVRDAKVIYKGVRLAVESLKAYRVAEPTSAIIVFCGNDEKNDKETDEHAKRIRAAFESVEGSLDVVIATSSEGEGKSRIEEFAKGRGDVLVVKQMASLGLDIERLMVGLDLSSVRTVAAMIQRDNRITTRFGSFKIATKIGPADKLSATIFEQFVRKQGGGKAITELEIAHAYEVQIESDPKSIMVVSGTDSADFRDTKGHEAERAFHDAARNLFAAFPEISMMMSRAEAMIRFAGHGMSIVSSIKEDDELITDVDFELNAIYEEINALAKALTIKAIGGHYDKSKAALYAETIKAISNRARGNVGIDLSFDLRELRNIVEVKRLRDEFLRMSSQGKESRRDQDTA